MLTETGIVVAFGQRVAGDELAAVFLEFELRRLAAVAGGDGDDLAAELGGLEVVGQRGDFDFAILGDEELEVRLDGGDDAAAVRAGVFLLVFVSFSAAKAGTASARAARSFSAMDFMWFVFGFAVWRNVTAAVVSKPAPRRRRLVQWAAAASFSTAVCAALRPKV